MNQSGFSLSIAASAKKGWQQLRQGLRSRVEGELLQFPRRDPLRPKCRKHLQGRHDCSWEYRGLPKNDRIYYKVFDQEKKIRIFYCGDHP